MVPLSTLIQDGIEHAQRRRRNGSLEALLLKTALEIRRQLSRELKKKRRRKQPLATELSTPAVSDNNTALTSDKENCSSEPNTNKAPNTADMGGNNQNSKTMQEDEGNQLFSLLDLALPLSRYKVDIGTVLRPQAESVPWLAWVVAAYPEAYRTTVEPQDGPLILDAISLVIECLEVEREQLSKRCVDTCTDVLQRLLSQLKHGMRERKGRGMDISDVSRAASTSSPRALCVGPTTPLFSIQQAAVQQLLQENEAMVKAPNTTSGTHRVFRVCP